MKNLEPFASVDSTETGAVIPVTFGRGALPPVSEHERYVQAQALAQANGTDPIEEHARLIDPASFEAGVSPANNRIGRAFERIASFVIDKFLAEDITPDGTQVRRK